MSFCSSSSCYEFLFPLIWFFTSFRPFSSGISKSLSSSAPSSFGSFFRSSLNFCECELTYALSLVPTCFVIFSQSFPYFWIAFKNLLCSFSLHWPFRLYPSPAADLDLWLFLKALMSRFLEILDSSYSSSWSLLPDNSSGFSVFQVWSI